jgi:nucleotide-binding universal stress UspA family protein
MTRPVVVGLDGSTNAAAALTVAIEVARGIGAEIVAVHAVGLLTHLGPGAPAVPSESCRDELAEVFENDWCAPLRASGISYRARLVAGDPVRALLSTAAEEDAGTIVVGTRGHREFAAVPLGSTSFQLVMGADRPVLVVPLPDPGAGVQESCG